MIRNIFGILQGPASATHMPTIDGLVQNEPFAENTYLDVQNRAALRRLVLFAANIAVQERQWVGVRE
jgi:hypothetical protein